MRSRGVGAAKAVLIEAVILGCAEAFGRKRQKNTSSESQPSLFRITNTDALHRSSLIHRCDSHHGQPDSTVTNLLLELVSGGALAGVVEDASLY